MADHQANRNMLGWREVAAKAARGVVVALLGASLVACSGNDEKSGGFMENLNPMNWFGDDDEKVAGEPMTTRDDPRKQKSYPKLGSVPKRPKRPSIEARTKNISRGLVADTQNARYTDQQLRQSSNVFGGQARPAGARRAETAARSPAPSTRTLATPRRAPAPIRPPAASRDVAGNSRVVPPPPLRRPSSVRAPLAAPAKIAPPPPPPSPRTALRPPAPVRAPAPAATAPPKPVVTHRAVAPPATAAPQPVPVKRRVVTRRPASSGLRPRRTAGRFATPVGDPVERPRSAPRAEPLRGPGGGRVATVTPPPAARLGATDSPEYPAETKTIQVGTIYFADGSAGLTKRDRSVLKAVSQVFNQTGGRVRVVGHSSLGAKTLDRERRGLINFEVSLKRANAVAAELVRQGVPADLVEAVAEGDRNPVYAETLSTGAAHNRRAEIFIDYLEKS